MPTNSKAPWYIRPFRAINTRVTEFLDRRPHRSFRRTRRRDYVRSLELPGYIAFTREVNRTLWGYRKLFLLLALVYAVLYGVLVGIGSQETYTQLTDTLRETSNGVLDGNWGELGKAGLLFVSIAGTGLAAAPSEVQQVYAILIALLVWVTTVWLLRQVLAGHKVRLRDGLYNAGTPLVAMFIVSLVFAVQLLPIVFSLLGFSAASASGLLAGGVEAMLFWMAAGLLGILSIFWVTSTLFAMIVVTLPGTYPLKALRIAGDIVLGRRVRILLRWVWMSVVAALAWVIVMIPIILFDTWLKSVWPALEWLPLIPIVLLAMTSVTVVWIASYVYLLYRKVVENDAAQ